MRWALVAVGVMLGCPAFAIPPPKDSEDYKIMMPQSDWISRQHDTLGRWCCDLGDAAIVDVRINADGQYEVHATRPDPIRGVPDGWLPVLQEKVVDLKGEPNPVGVAVAWFWQGRVQCFIPTAGM